MSVRKTLVISVIVAVQISLIISAIYFICTFIKGLVSKPVGDFAVYYWAIGCVVGTLLIYFIFYEIIFKGEDIARSERERQVEVATRQCLSKTDYRQVYFLYESCDKMDMICKFCKKKVVNSMPNLQKTIIYILLLKISIMKKFIVLK